MMNLKNMSIVQAAHAALFARAHASGAGQDPIDTNAAHAGLKRKFQMDDVNLADVRLQPQTRELFAVLLQRYAQYLDRCNNGLDNSFEMRQRAHAVGMDLKTTWLRLFAGDYSHEVVASSSDVSPLSNGGFDVVDVHRFQQARCSGRMQ
jgi:hypothetical protein